MKTSEIVFLRTLQFASIALGILTFSAIIYAFVQIAIGNVHSTASFEF
jgi:hypothetical protein